LEHIAAELDEAERGLEPKCYAVLRPPGSCPRPARVGRGPCL